MRRTLVIATILLLALLLGGAAEDSARVQANRAEFAASFAAFEREDCVAAAQGFSNLVGRYDELADYVLFYGALSAQRLDQHQSALAYCERLILEQPASRMLDSAQELRLSELLELQRYGEAGDLAQQQLDQLGWPGDARLRFVLARSLEGRGQFVEAAHQYLLLSTLFKGNEWQQQADRRVQALLREERASAPRLSEAEMLEAARSHFERGHPRTAGQIGQELIERGISGDAAAEAKVYQANSLGRSEREQEQQQALILFNEVIDRGRPEQWVAAALYLATELLPAEQRDLRLQAVLQRFPATEWAGRAAYDLAGQSWSARDFDRAAERYLFSTERLPQSTRRRTALWRGGFSAYMAGRFERAVAALETSAEVEPDSEDVQRALYWRGRSLEAAGSTAEAVQGYFAVLDKGPDEYYALLAGERLRSLGVPPLIEARRFAGLTGVGALTGAAIGVRPSEAAPEALLQDAIRAADEYAAYHLLRLRELLAMGLDEPGLAEVQVLRAARNYGGPLAAARLAQVLWRQDRRWLSLLAANNGHRLAGMQGLPDGFGELGRLRLPRPFFEEIKLKADDYSVDPYMVLGLMRQESAFNSRACSSAGARGLMQVMPATGKYIARKRGLADGYSNDQLYDSAVSIDFGCWYISHMLDASGGDPVRAIASYNAGPGNAKKWWPGFGGLEAAAAVELIPLSETSNYVKVVVRNWTQYRALYLGRDADPPIRLLTRTIN